MQKDLFSPNIDTGPFKLLLKSAGALLARRSYSRGELKDKLSKMADEHAVESALDRLEKLNLLNDADYAYNFAFCRIRQRGWSPDRVQSSLIHRQIEQKTIEIALERVRSELGNEPVLENYLRKYCGKRGLPADLKALRKLIAHLRRRGFTEESILDALRLVVPAAMLQRLETGD
jgi:SOS response regulatory protein OraA/RecX